MEQEYEDDLDRREQDRGDEYDIAWDGRMF
jgi:hypothetical protein